MIDYYEAFEKTASGNCVLVPSDKLAEMQAEIEALNKTVKRLREDIDLPASDIEEFVLHKYEYFAKCKTIASQQAEIEALKEENAKMKTKLIGHGLVKALDNFGKAQEK